MMVQNEKVWLVKHTYLPGWFLPGGGIKKWETLDEAARREAREETGANLGEMTFIGVFTSNLQWKTDHTAVFLCKEFNFTGTSDAEIAELHEFQLDGLPEETYHLHRKLLENYSKGRLLHNVGEW